LSLPHSLSQVTLDDTFEVSPFKDTYLVARAPGAVLAAALHALLAAALPAAARRTSDARLLGAALPDWVATVAPEELDAGATYDLVFVEFDQAHVAAALRRAAGGVDVPAAPFRVGKIDSRSVWEAFVGAAWPCDARAVRAADAAREESEARAALLAEGAEGA
jgi:hypothetical protein